MRQNVTYFAPAHRIGSGMGIVHESIVHYLGQKDDVTLRLIELPSADGASWATMPVAAAKAMLSGVQLVLDGSEIVLMAYPSVPLVPLTSRVKVPLAYATYAGLQMRKRYTGQKLVLFIGDLPIEQAEGLGLPITIDRGMFNRWERFLFHAADHVVAFSPRLRRVLCDKHGLNEERVLMNRRDPHMPRHVEGRAEIALTQGKVHVLYSGELTRMQDIVNVRQVLEVVGRFPQTAEMHVCGRGGEWVTQQAARNVRYWGMLNHADFDALASQCSFGVIAYPHGWYYDLTPTAKYSGYAANGLAILSTDLSTVRENLEEDGIGEALPLPEMLDELSRWCADPVRFAGYRARAAGMKELYRRGAFMDEWFNELRDR